MQVSNGYFLLAKVLSCLKQLEVTPRRVNHAIDYLGVAAHCPLLGAYCEMSEEFFESSGGRKEGKKMETNRRSSNFPIFEYLSTGVVERGARNRSVSREGETESGRVEIQNNDEHSFANPRNKSTVFSINRLH